MLEDPGGEPLERVMGTPMEVGGSCASPSPWPPRWARCMNVGLIHKDIKPANVLGQLGAGEVWLTGFGIASRLPRERQAPEPPEVIAGTLAYMAPEQTGRMNRSIDSRSDLYCARRHALRDADRQRCPFTASDPMEWVHCHIARQPVPPAERVAGRPGAGLGDHHEAARQDRRGALPDRGRRRSAICGAAWPNGRRTGASTTSRLASTTRPTGC